MKKILYTAVFIFLTVSYSSANKISDFNALFNDPDAISGHYLYFGIFLLLIAAFVILLISLIKKNKKLISFQTSVDNEKNTQKQVQNNAAELNEKKELENLRQKLFAQQLEVEQRNTEVQLYIDKLKEQKKQQEALNQKLFAQKMEVEQRNSEIELYTKSLEQQKKEQEALNQKLFAQNMEVEQRNSEIELYTKSLEQQKKEQEALNQKLFAQKLEVEQRSSEIELYTKSLEEQKKSQEILNQQLFAQKLEVEQRNFEVEQYAVKIEEQKKEQDKLNQKLFAQSLEVDQKRFEIEMYSKEIEKLKDKAEEAYKNINDSIHYAKSIIDSLLPEKELFNELFPDDSFILFKPKESIGGDFYYLNKIDNYTIFSVADCTGHGVPGALIAMLGITFLNEISERRLAENTGKALDILREKIKHIFKSYGKDIQNKNGMDLSLCAVDRETNIMEFSGAFNSIYIIRNNELTEYRANRNPIGYYPIEKEFTTTEIKLENNDLIYLFSDGYKDQTNHETGKKMTREQFKKLLLEIHTFPMEKQRKFLDDIFTKWKGKTNQIDDVSIMGIKWKI